MPGRKRHPRPSTVSASVTRKIVVPPRMRSSQRFARSGLILERSARDPSERRAVRGAMGKGLGPEEHRVSPACVLVNHPALRGKVHSYPESRAAPDLPAWRYRRMEFATDVLPELITRRTAQDLIHLRLAHADLDAIEALPVDSRGRNH